MVRPLSIVLVLVVWAVAAGDIAETIDGRRLKGSVTVAGGQAVVGQGERAQALSLADMSQLQLADDADMPTAAMHQTGRTVVVLREGSHLAVAGLAIGADALHATHALAGRLTLPMQAVAAVYRPTANQTAADVKATCEALSLATDDTFDHLLLVGKDGQEVTAAGALRGAGPQKTVRFAMGDAERPIPLDRIRAVLLAAPETRPGVPAGLATLRDGSTVGFQSLEIGQEARLVGGPLGTLVLPRPALIGVTFRSDRVRPLTDLRPVEVREYGLMDWTFGHRLGRSAAGTPLSLDGQTYERGLGLHSFCELTYELDGRYAWFLATVGIDDSVRPQGDATLTILGDGQPLGDARRVHGREGAQRLRVDVAGVRRLTIRVDFGADELDVGDRVDLVDARLVRVSPETSDN